MKSTDTQPPTENQIRNGIMLAAYRCGAVLFRNNVGVLRDRHGTPVRYGLCAGSADLIGWTIAHGVAVFTAVECKTAAGRLSDRQRRFLEVVSEQGGIGLVCRSVEQYLLQMQERR